MKRAHEPPGALGRVLQLHRPGALGPSGRRPVVVGFNLLGLLVPLAALYCDSSLYLLGALIFLGWSASGTFPLFMGTIPSETIPARYVATSLGLTVGIGEILGGVSAPAVAGWAADRYSLAAPMFIQAGCARRRRTAGAGSEGDGPQPRGGIRGCVSTGCDLRPCAPDAWHERNRSRGGVRAAARLRPHHHLRQSGLDRAADVPRLSRRFPLRARAAGVRGGRDGGRLRTGARQRRVREPALGHRRRSRPRAASSRPTATRRRSWSPPDSRPARSCRSSRSCTRSRPPNLPRPYVKWSCEPARAEDVPAAIARAYYTAMQSPRGPTFVSVPVDDWDRACDPVAVPRGQRRRRRRPGAAGARRRRCSRPRAVRCWWSAPPWRATGRGPRPLRSPSGIRPPSG